MSKSTITRLTALIIIVLTCYAHGLDGTVVEIRVEGNRRVDTETIKSYLATKEGDRFFARRVQQDIKNIYAQGFFSDVRVEGEQTPRGVILTYVVEEKPLVKSVKYSGNKKIEESEIEKVIEVTEHQALNMTDVKNTEKAIHTLYEKKGFFLAEVSTDIEETDDGQVKVTFVIQENERVVVKDVVFLGNEAYSDKELQSKIMTRPQNVLSFITKQGYFQQEEFDLDVARLTFWYYDNGYIRVKIDPPQVFLSPDKSSITVVFRITEGPQFFVGKLDMAGDMLRPKEEMMNMLTLEEGDVYSASRLKADMDKLADFYSDYGYADANIVPQSKVHEEDHTVDITFHILKGLKIYVERIDITGNDKTRDMVIRRQLKIKEGQLYSGAAIRRSEASVKRLGFFEQVKILPSAGSATDKRKLTVVVEEKSTGTLSAGAGFSSNEQLIFNGQVSQDNLFGRGQSLSLNIFWGRKTQNFKISFYDPYFLDTRWSFRINSYIYIRDFIDFQRRDAGGSVTVGHLLPRSDFTRAYISALYQDTKLSDFPNFRSIFDRIPFDTTTTSVTLGFSRNTTNNYLDPSAGMTLNTSVEYAGRYLGGENVFLKYTLKGKYFQPVYKGTYLGFVGALGLLDQNQGDRLLLTERYFLGGIDDLRGFELRSLGPAYPSDDPQLSDLVIGGNKQLVLSVDYIVPLVKQMGIKGVVFMDAGNAFNDDEPIDLNNLRWDWGFGIRWVSPLGPLRFELGFPIDRRKDEKSKVFQFAIGSPLR